MAGRYLLLIQLAGALARRDVEACLGAPVEPLSGWWLASDVSRLPGPVEVRWRVARASWLADGLGICAVTTEGCSEIDVFRAGRRQLVFELDFEGLSESNLLEILRQISESEGRDAKAPDRLPEIAATRPVPTGVLDFLEVDEEVLSRLRAGATVREALRRVAADRASAIAAAFALAPGPVDRQGLVEVLAGKAGAQGEPATPFHNLPDLLEVAGVEGLVRQLVDSRYDGRPDEPWIRDEGDSGCPLSCALPILMFVTLATLGGVSGHRALGGFGMACGVLGGLFLAYVLATWLLTRWTDRDDDGEPGLPDIVPLARQDVLASLDPEAVPWARRMVADWSEVSGHLACQPIDDPRGVWEAMFHAREAPHVSFLLERPRVGSVREAAVRIAEFRVRLLGRADTSERSESLRSEYRQWMEEKCRP